ncbi:MAG TPA: hypothetical protein VHH34_10825 [Pseudonocardiaceae bacterium]|nr:hypothetical protein [Pseudonocardiaceae bacterium]
MTTPALPSDRCLTAAVCSLHQIAEPMPALIDRINRRADGVDGRPSR